MLPIVSTWFQDSDSTFAWLIDLGSHWQWLFWWGLVISVLFLTWQERRWAAFFLMLPLPWFTASIAVPRQEQGEVSFSILSANVYFENRDVRPLQAWLLQERPDAAVLLEITSDYAAGLKSLVDYPYQHIVAEQEPFGLALISRYPLLETHTIRDSEGIAHIESQVQLPGQPIGLMAFHTMPPLSQHYHQIRNDQLRILARHAQMSAFPTLIAGDINATPWSSAFSLVDRYGLRRATGLAPSWPSIGHGLFGIPIDHVIATPHWRVISEKLGPNIGSDHYPILVRLGLVNPLPGKN